MADSDIARELVALGLPWQPGMKLNDGSRILWASRIEETMAWYATCVDVTSDGAVCTVVGAGDILPIKLAECDWPDLSDKATLALVEDWVRGLWFARGAVSVEVRHAAGGEAGVCVYMSSGSAANDAPDWNRWCGNAANALLAAARAALGGG